MKQSISLICLLLVGTFSFAAKPLRPCIPTPPGTTVFNAKNTGDQDQSSNHKKKKQKKQKGNDYATFQQGAGVSLFFAPGNAAEVDNSTKGFGGSYFPSVQLKSLGSNSLRLAASPSVWFNLQSSRSGSNSGSGGFASFLLDVPVALELHLGDPGQGNGFGGHLGIGFGINRMGATDQAANNAFGPHFSAGLRWNTFGQTWGLRANYLLNIKSKKDEYGFRPKNVCSLSLCNYF